MSKRITYLELKGGAQFLVDMEPENFNKLVIEDNGGPLSNVFCKIPLYSGSSTWILVRNISNFTEVDPPKEKQGLNVDERDDGAKITLQSGLKQMSVDFKDDEALIKEFLIYFTEDVLREALRARMRA